MLVDLKLFMAEHINAKLHRFLREVREHVTTVRSQIAVTGFNIATWYNTSDIAHCYITNIAS